MSRLSGVRLNFSLRNSLGDFTADAFVISEREMRPFGDVSLAGVVDYNYKKIINFGLGAELYRLFPVNSKFTTPRFDNSGLYEVSGLLYDTAGAVIGYRDSSFYSFTGTKIMAHVTFDPLFFLRDSEVGRLIGEGGKVYGEVNLLGLKNYPRNDTARKEPDGITPYPGQFSYGYDTLLNKMPISFGINIPVPFIDVCALEFEYYRMRYPDNFREVFVNNRPLPGYYINNYSAANVPENSYSESDNWKWSLYLKKNINKNFHIVFQAARDHQRWTIPAFIWGQYSDWEDICMRPANWIWNLKGEVAF